MHKNFVNCSRHLAFEA